MRKNILLSMVEALLGIVLGILCIVINGYDLIRFVAVCSGIIILLFATISLIQVLITGNFKSADFIVALVVVAIWVTMGILLICIPGTVMFYIAGGLLLVLPALRILVAEHHYAQFKEELVNLILGTIIIVFGLGGVVDVLFTIMGIVLISLCTLAMVYYVLLIVAAKKALKEEKPIDAETQKEAE